MDRQTPKNKNWIHNKMMLIYIYKHNSIPVLSHGYTESQQDQLLG